MWLSLILLALIAAITYFQTINGLFSALITSILTILCATFAFAIHEYVALELLYGWKPQFALSLSLVLTFAVPLILLRVLVDSFIRRQVMLPTILDKAGSVVFAFVSAMITMGVVAAAIQMLPFGESFLGFARVDVADPEFEHTEPGAENSLLFEPDRFAVGFASLMSNGVLSGQRRWHQDHPDYMQEVGWAQAVPRGVAWFAPRDGIQQIVSMHEETYVYSLPRSAMRGSGEEDEPTPEPAKAGYRFLAVVFTPSPSVKDEDNQKRFSPYQVRLLGHVGDEIRQYHPTAVRYSERNIYVRKKWGRTTQIVQMSVLGDLFQPDGNGEIGVAYEVPADFQPHYIEFKMAARKAAKKVAEAPDREDVRLPTGGEDTGARRRPPRGGRTHGANVTAATFGDRLPGGLAGTKFTSVADAEIRNNELRKGHIIGQVTGVGRGQPVNRFHVPQGQALLQLDVVNLRAGSILGRAKSFAVKTVKNYIITDERGRQYKICGQIAVADVGGERIAEIQYFPEAIGSIGGVRDFSRIRDHHLQGDYQLYFLFVVNSGARLKTFSTTGRRGGEDISDLGLVAP